MKTAQEFYNSAIKILDSLYIEGAKLTIKLSPDDTWKQALIFNFFRQSTHILYVLLSNSENSKIQQSIIVKETILMGTLGRIIRDIYVNVIYLRTNKFSQENMELCWNFQVTYQNLNLIKFDEIESIDEQIKELEKEKGRMKEKLSTFTFTTQGNVFQGKDEKLLSLKELANIKGFNYEKFYNEFQIIFPIYS